MEGGIPTSMPGSDGSAGAGYTTYVQPQQYMYVADMTQPPPIFNTQMMYPIPASMPPPMMVPPPGAVYNYAYSMMPSGDPSQNYMQGATYVQNYSQEETNQNGSQPYSQGMTPQEDTSESFDSKSHRNRNQNSRSQKGQGQQYQRSQRNSNYSRNYSNESGTPEDTVVESDEVGNTGVTGTQDYQNRNTDSGGYGARPKNFRGRGGRGRGKETRYGNYIPPDQGSYQNNRGGPKRTPRYKQHEEYYNQQYQGGPQCYEENDMPDEAGGESSYAQASNSFRGGRVDYRNSRGGRSQNSTNWRNSDYRNRDSAQRSYYNNNYGYRNSDNFQNTYPKNSYQDRRFKNQEPGGKDFRGKSSEKNGHSGTNKKDNNVNKDDKMKQDQERLLEGIGGKNKKKEGRGLNNRERHQNRPVKKIPSRDKLRAQAGRKVEDGETQRGSLIEQLSGATYECMVCCDSVRCEAAIWSCANCYHVFHLRCVKRWARSPAASIEGGTTGWRCPACQNVSSQFPHQYRCFCGKVQDPDYNRYETPHSCGEVCSKKRPNDCIHPCNILCHPGPCPPCSATITKKCDCGKTKPTVKCGQQPSVKCEETCGKQLNCGQHTCQTVCHPGSCQPCEVTIEQACYCEKNKREVTCGTAEAFARIYSCDQPCRKSLDCGNHLCDSVCHAGTCEQCTLIPQAVTHCPCGQTKLDDLPNTQGPRTSCLDPIPTCDNVCNKPLPCGPENRPHMCSQPCHEGECPPCDGTTNVQCRCGRLLKELPCKEVMEFTADNPFLCDRRCQKKRTCGHHKCGQVCCVDTEHKCSQICAQKLSCGTHRCEELCHRGNCPPCWQVSFDELHCHCGAEVLFPPVPCGARPPECRHLCTREHPCDHAIQHNCHSEENCPPCTHLTEKWCMGKHELRKNIACYLVDISCGLPCGSQLSCGEHKCQRLCHKGECSTEEDKCNQPCQRSRPECSHPCGNPCHPDDACPKTPCQTEITIKCKCGNRQERALCLQGGASSQDYQKMATMMMAMKMADVQSGQAIDITSLTGQGNKMPPRELECTSDCAVKERNRRLAIALEIHNPELRTGNTTYTEFLKTFAKSHVGFVAGVEKDLSQLVNNAQTGKMPKRSHAFPPMNREQRRVIHELSDYYGCESQSYDEEPKKNVVATAVKNKCWIPKETLTAQIQRELHRKAPVPIPPGSRQEDIRKSVEVAKQSTHIMTEQGWTQSRSAAPRGSWAARLKTTPGGATASATTATGATANGASASVSSGTKSNMVTLSRKDPAKAEAKPKQPVIDYFDMT